MQTCCDAPMSATFESSSPRFFMTVFFFPGASTGSGSLPFLAAGLGLTALGDLGVLGRVPSDAAAYGCVNGNNVNDMIQRHLLLLLELACLGLGCAAFKDLVAMCGKLELEYARKQVWRHFLAGVDGALHLDARICDKLAGRVFRLGLGLGGVFDLYVAAKTRTDGLPPIQTHASVAVLLTTLNLLRTPDAATSMTMRTKSMEFSRSPSTSTTYARKSLWNESIMNQLNCKMAEYFHNNHAYAMNQIVRVSDKKKENKK